MAKCSSIVIIISLVVAITITAIVGTVVFFVLRAENGDQYPPTTTTTTTTSPPTVTEPDIPDSSTPDSSTPDLVTDTQESTLPPTLPPDEFDLDGDGFGSLRQDFNYVNVKPGGYMFWWLFYASDPEVVYTEKPLIIWLQGLFDEASSGHGVFQIFKLYNMSLPAEGTESSLVNDYNILFIDAPLGTGFSYVSNTQAIEQSTEETADDIVTLLISFYDNHPEFELIPLHIFGQFYGAKVAAELGWKLTQAINDNRINADLQSVALGNGLISPADSLEYWGTYLESLGYIDGSGRVEVDNYAQNAVNFFNDGDYWQGAIAWFQTMQIALRESVGINVYHVIEKPEYIPPSPQWIDLRSSMNALTRNSEQNYFTRLYAFMNNEVRSVLGIPARVMWNNQRSVIMDATLAAVFTPSNHIVSRLLNETDIKVIIYNGNLDLLSNTPGQIQWVDNLEWSGAEEFKANSIRQTLFVGTTVEGYYKSYENLHFYWINAAGLRTPADSPNGIRGLLDRVTSNSSSFKMK